MNKQILPIIILCSFVAAAIMVLYGIEPSKKSQDFLKKYQFVYEGNPIDQVYDNDQDELNRMKWLYDQRKEYYNTTLNSLQIIQKGLIVIILVSILVLVFGAKQINVFSIAIPEGLIYFFILIGGVYLWINFGLTLNSALNSRMSLHHLARIIETNNFGRINYQHSLEHTLADASFIDNWCSHYYNIFERSGYTNKTTKFFGYLGMYGLYSYVFGLFHACAITATYEFGLRKNINAKIQYIMLVFVVIMLLLGSLSFGNKFQHAFVWIGSIWFVNGIGLVYWYYRGKRLVEKNYHILKSKQSAKKNTDE